MSIPDGPGPDQSCLLCLFNIDGFIFFEKQFLLHQGGGHIQTYKLVLYVFALKV